MFTSDGQTTTSQEREIDETIEADHDQEYNIMDKCGEANKDIKVLDPTNVQLQQPLRSTGDYDYTWCPAYVPIATASINNWDELESSPSHVQMIHD